MNFSVYNNAPIGQIFAGFSPRVSVYTPRRSSADNLLINTELDRFLNKHLLSDMVNSNPVVLSILKSHNLKPVVNVENFKATTYKHSVDTKNIAGGMYNYLPADLKSEANIGYIQKGALLHDLGKVLIPENILNKKGKLSPEESDIMRLHSKLSEAMLSSQNIEPEVLNIVKYHHQDNNKTGYPEIKNTLKGFDINTEIVSVADKYSALTENRSYKTALSSAEALEIIKKDVSDGKINPRIYNALVGYVNNMEKPKLNPQSVYS